MTHSPAVMTIPDYRRPGQSLPPASLRLPAEILDPLDGRGDRLQTTRAGLTRALLAQGLERLQFATAAP